MANPTLADILWRNQGNLLTPELIVGLVQGANYLQEQANAAELAAQRLSTATVPIPIPGDWVAAPNPRPSHKRLVLDQHERVANWVAEQTGCSAHAWAGYVCLGLEDEHGMLIAGIVLESFNGRNANAHIAGIGRHWMNRNMLTSFFHYAFNHLKLTRLTGLVPRSNFSARAFDEHAGFKYECTLVDGAADGDLDVLVMRREDCRYLPVRDAGDQPGEPAGATLTA